MRHQDALQAAQQAVENQRLLGAAHSEVLQELEECVFSPARWPFPLACPCPRHPPSPPPHRKPENRRAVHCSLRIRLECCCLS